MHNISVAIVILESREPTITRNLRSLIILMWSVSFVRGDKGDEC